MGKAARAKRDLREAGPLPDKFAFGPEFLVRSTARQAEATPDLLGIHDFGETGEHPCPKCGGEVVYRYGNWICPPADPDEYEPGGCGWSTAKDATGGRGSRGMNNGKTTLEKCPDCGARVVYNGNYFCERWGGECWWALPHPARRAADRELALRLTGKAS